MSYSVYVWFKPPASRSALERLGLPADADGWEIRGLIVTGREALAPFIDDLPFACVPFEELAVFLADPLPDDGEADAA